MDLGLNGKSVIVTGGTGGIGQGVVREFAREGANVACADRDGEAALKLAGDARREGLPGKVLGLETDITNRASVDTMVAAARAAHGPIEILVNVAGGVAGRYEFENLGQDVRDLEIALNINGTVNCTQAAGADMLVRGGGSVVNISSISALVPTQSTRIVHYGAVKGFMNSFAMALAYEWAPRGVRINTIAPGWIVPHRLDDVGRQSQWAKNTVPPEEMPRLLAEGKLRGASVPLGRVGRPEDIAWLALFLASDKSSYITGQIVSVSGGVHMTSG